MTCGLYYKNIRSVKDDSKSVIDGSRSVNDDSKSIIDDCKSIIDDSRSVIDDSRAMLQIVASRTDNSRVVNYAPRGIYSKGITHDDHHMTIVKSS